MLVGDRLGLTDADVLCCVPPLSHCFGLVCGLLACLVHGGTLVIPSQVFDPVATVRSVAEEHCTMIIAVPTMFDALLKRAEKLQVKPPKLRGGLIAGSSLSQDMLYRIASTFGLPELSYPFGQ